MEKFTYLHSLFWSCFIVLVHLLMQLSQKDRKSEQIDLLILRYKGRRKTKVAKLSFL
ncbi:hypothetical protein ACJIZ3_006142 [Penstemon smallii]|uniref:Uncharacterized protein n=1 Tax=Penstemon smallii TaxID=265156 RepID=A0ABD3S774_9LAMI